MATPHDVDDTAPALPPAPRRRTGLLIAIVVSAIVALGLVWLVRYERHGKYVENTNDAYIRADMVTVSSKISGYVDRVYVADNQDVVAGQPIVAIDPRDYRAQTAQYQAQIEVSAANAENVRAGILEQRAAVDRARAELDAARADARFAAGEVDRYVPLAASGAEPREKLASLRNRAAQATATVAARAASLAEAEQRIGSLSAQVRQAGAQGRAARAQLTAADVNLGSAVIRAPVAGRIGDKGVRVGQFVTSGARMMSIVPLASLYVIANFKETQLGLMRAGQPARISVDALPGVTLSGHVESLAPGTGAQFSLLPPQNATGNFTKIVQRVPVRIAIDAGPRARRILVAGLSVEVEVDTIAARNEMDGIESDEQARRDRR